MDDVRSSDAGGAIEHDLGDLAGHGLQCRVQRALNSELERCGSQHGGAWIVCRRKGLAVCILANCLRRWCRRNDAADEAVVVGVGIVISLQCECGVAVGDGPCNVIGCNRLVRGVHGRFQEGVGVG